MEILGVKSLPSLANIQLLVSFCPLSAITRIWELVHGIKSQSKRIEGFQDGADFVHTTISGDGRQKRADTRENIMLLWH